MGWDLPLSKTCSHGKDINWQKGLSGSDVAMWHDSQDKWIEKLWNAYNNNASMSMIMCFKYSVLFWGWGILCVPVKYIIFLNTIVPKVTEAYDRVTSGTMKLQCIFFIKVIVLDVVKTVSTPKWMPWNSVCAIMHVWSVWLGTL